MSHELSLEDRVTVLEDEVERLKTKQQPGRKKVPMLAPHQPGVCGLDPDCDSAECEQFSVYRYQQGCRGTACVGRNREYYAENRAAKAAQISTNGH